MLTAAATDAGRCNWRLFEAVWQLVWRMFISVSTTFVFQFVSIGFVVSMVRIAANLVGRRFHWSLLLLMTLVTFMAIWVVEFSLAQCVELELRWRFYVHGSTCP